MENTNRRGILLIHPVVFENSEFLYVNLYYRVSNMHVAARKKKEKRSKSAESNDSDHYTNTFSCVIDHLLELQSHENDESWDDEMTSEMVRNSTEL